MGSGSGDIIRTLPSRVCIANSTCANQSRTINTTLVARSTRWRDTVARHSTEFSLDSDHLHIRLRLQQTTSLQAAVPSGVGTSHEAVSRKSDSTPSETVECSDESMVVPLTKRRPRGNRHRILSLCGASNRRHPLTLRDSDKISRWIAATLLTIRVPDIDTATPSTRCSISMRLLGCLSGTSLWH